ncbi:MAG: GNAT family N-acetyltransferase [Thermodesulfobacteriota bacterium]
MDPDTAFRREVRPEDREAVERLVRTTGYFSREECAIAVELVDERLTKGNTSGYSFLFTEAGNELIGYSCFGPVPGTAHSYDLYWIAVAPHAQGRGLGRKLLDESERLMAGQGARRVYAETSSRSQYKPTHAFYLACGYVQEAFLSDFYAPDDGKIIFVKILK